MANLIQMPRAAWRRQPNGPSELNWSDPLADGLIDQWNPANGLFSYSGKNNLTRIGNIRDSVSLGGISWEGIFQNSDNYLKADRTNFTYTEQVSFEAVLLVKRFQTFISPYITGIITQYCSSTQLGPVLRFGDATTPNADKPYFSITKSGVEKIAQSPVSLRTGVVYHILGSYDGKAVKIFVNGVLCNSLSLTGSFTNDSGNYIAICTDYPGQAVTDKRCLDGHLFLARIWSTGTSDAKARELSNNPWQLLKPRLARIIFIPAAGGTGVDISIPATTIAVAPVVPSVSSGCSIAVPATTIAVAPVAPTIQTGCSIAIPATNVAVDAPLPTIQTGCSVAVPATTIAVAPVAPTISAGLTIAAPATNVAVAPIAPTISAGCSVAVPATTIAVAAPLPTITTGINLSVPATTIAVAPVAPTIQTGCSIAIPATNVAVDAPLPTIVAGCRIDVPATAIVVLPLVPVVQAGSVLPSVDISPPAAIVRIRALPPFLGEPPAGPNTPQIRSMTRKFTARSHSYRIKRAA